MTYTRPIHRFGVLITASEKDDNLAERIATAFADYRLVILRGLEITTSDAFTSFCTRTFQRELLHWETGHVMEMKPSATPKNYLFSTERVPFHWDGAFHQTPSILAFQCLKAPSAQSGGETLFTNTEAILAESHPKERGQWEKVRLTYKTEKLAHYGGTFTTPLIVPHPVRGTEVLRFAEEVKTKLNPVCLTVGGIRQLEIRAFVGAMRRRIYHPNYCYTHEWRTGDVVFADNHSLIHARHAFLRKTDRHLRRIQIL